MPVRIDPMTVIAQMIEKGYDPSALAQMMELKRQYDKDRAAEAFAEAIAGFQAECPQILKENVVMNKDVAKGERYRFASFENVMTAISPYLAKFRIAVTFSSPPQPDGMNLTICRLQVGNHFADHPFSAPWPNIERIATAMYMTEAQAVGMVRSYFKRYALCDALNLVVAKEDNDAGTLVDLASPEELGQADTLIHKKKASLPGLLKWASTAAGFEIPTLAEIPAGLMPNLLDMLRRKPDPK